MSRKKATWADPPRTWPRYRLICSHPGGNRTDPVLHFQASNDAEAIQLAAEWRASRTADLWRAYRVVMHWEQD